MKTVSKLFTAAAIAFAAVACQVIDEGQIVTRQLEVTATIAEDEASKVDYTIDNDKNIISPTWHKGDTPDQIIGFDNLGTTFTFTVNEVTDEGKNAKFDLGGYELDEGVTKLYAIYAPKVEASSIDRDNKTLAIDLSTQGGVLDGEAPVLMCATAEIVKDQVNFVFENKTAIIGVKKFQLNGSTMSHTVTSMTLNGVITTGTFHLEGDNLVLTPGSTTSSITATGEWTTDASGVCTTAVYFAAMPTSDAKMKLSASTAPGTSFGNVAEISQVSIFAGHYYYMSKKLASDYVAIIGETKYTTIDAAWTYANSSDEDVTITLLADCSASAKLALTDAATGKVTLDLNGQKITGPASGYTVDVRGGRSLTICDNSSADIEKQGSIEGINNNHTIYTNDASTTLSITGGSIIAPDFEKYTIYLAGESSATISGGKLLSSNFCGIYVGAKAGCTMSGEGTIESNSYCIYSAGVSTVSGGYFSASDKSVELFVVSGSGKCSVTGGYFDRALNSYRTRNSEGYVRSNYLNTSSTTKEKYPFRVANRTRLFNVVKEGSTTEYWHDSAESAAKQASDATVNTTISPRSDQTDLNAMILDNPDYTITLDLDNKSISAKSGTTPFIDVRSEVEIKNGTISSQDTATVRVHDGALTINNCTIIKGGTKTLGGYYYNNGVIINSRGKLEINNSTVYTGTKNISLILSRGDSANKNNTKITNCTVVSSAESTSTSNSSPAVTQFIYGDTEINRGYYYSNTPTDSRATINRASTSAEDTQTGSITIKDGYFYNAGKGLCLRGNYNVNIKWFTIEGGYFSSNPETPVQGNEPNISGTVSEESWSQTVTVNENTYTLKGDYKVTSTTPEP